MAKKKLKIKRTEQNRQKLANEAFNLFGRIKNKHIILNLKILKEEKKWHAGIATWVMGRLIDKEKIVALTDPNDEVVWIVRKKRGWLYKSEELVNLINEKYFKKVGKLLQQVLNFGYTILNKEFLEKYEEEVELTAEILQQAIYCFIDAGLVSINAKNQMRLTQKGSHTTLNYNELVDALTSSMIAFRYVKLAHLNISRIINITSVDDLEKLYEQDEKDKEIFKLTTSQKENQLKIMPLSELMVGNQDLDVKFFKRTIAQLKALPQEEKPDLFTIDGIIQGTFKHRQKNRRLHLVLNMKKMNSQLSAAKMLIDECRKLEIQTVYNKGDDDLEVCIMNTVNALQLIRNISKPQKDKDKVTINYHQLDKLMQDDAWDFHLEFQWKVVFAYMLLCGRKLYSADEVAKIFGRRIEEYIMLLAVHECITENKPIPDPFFESVVDVEKLKLVMHGLENYIITADFNLISEFKNGKKKVTWHRHNFHLTEAAMLHDPTKAARAILAQLAAAGKETPDVYVVAHQQQAQGILNGKTFVISTPSFQTANLNRNSFVSNIKSAQNTRNMMSRRKLAFAGATPYTLTDDGRILVDFYNEQFLDLAYKTNNRHTICFGSDWQIGSVTARPDLAVKLMDLWFHKTLPLNPTFMADGGDHDQGRNYPEMPNENVRMGLIRMHDQSQFDRGVAKNVLSCVPFENFNNLIGLGFSLGNHEWNLGGKNGHSRTGINQLAVLANTFSDFFEYKLNKDIPVKLYDKVATKSGEHFNAWIGKETIAGYGVVFQHMILEKGGKGSGGVPASQGKTLVEGLGHVVEDFNIVLTSHYHHPHYFMIANKLFAVNGSIAGLSGYEYARGYYPVIGSILLHLGGGLPPTLEILTLEYLLSYTPQGYYSRQNLAKLGFEDDKKFNPAIHGFARFKNQPQSAIQKALWADVDNLNWQTQSTL